MVLEAGSKEGVSPSLEDELSAGRDKLVPLIMVREPSKVSLGTLVKMRLLNLVLVN